MKLTDKEKKILQDDEELAYQEYNKKIGGEPIGLIVPFGYPPGVEEKGGVIAVYKECIKKGVTWEKLLNYNHIDEWVDV